MLDSVVSIDNIPPPGACFCGVELRGWESTVPGGEGNWLFTIPNLGFVKFGN